MESIHVEQVAGMSNEAVLDQLFPTPVAVHLVSQVAYEEAVDALKRWAYHYHHQLPLEGPISDGNYDDILAQVAEYEAAHPSEVRPDSPVGKVKGGVFEPDFSVERLAVGIQGQGAPVPDSQ